MKVFFAHSPLNGCYNVRCLFPLQANGWDGYRTTFLPSKMSEEYYSKAMADADIVVFHRPDRKEKLQMLRELKKAGKKVVFENDDTNKDHGGFKFNEYMDEARMKAGIERIDSALDNFIKEADLVTCSTEFLAKEYRLLNDNVVVLPNCIDPFYFEEPKRNDTDVVRIGITGSVGTTSDLEVLKPIVEHYQNDPRVRLVLLSMPTVGEDTLMKELYKDEYEFWTKINIEWHTFIPSHEYYDYLNDLKLDMVIIPRYNSLFNRCKSNLKFLEDSMFEIPSIGQAFSTGDSPYQQNPEDQKYLLLADTFEEWITQIEKLITDKELRQEMGRKAKEYVEANYDINKNSYRWVEAYSKLLDTK